MRINIYASLLHPISPDVCVQPLFLACLHQTLGGLWRGRLLALAPFLAGRDPFRGGAQALPTKVGFHGTGHFSA